MPEKRYRMVDIPKSRGRVRTLCVPSRPWSAELRLHVGEIARLARRADRNGVQHGFTRCKSPVTCATVHIGHAWTWSGDLTDCFRSVTEQHLRGKIRKDLLAEILVDGSPLQGLPTSPSAVNLALVPLDDAIVKWAKRKGHQVVYTRYADDLMISGDSPATLAAVQEMIPQIVRRCGFRLAAHKTRTQLASAGVRHVVGVGVDDQGVRPTRAAKRRLRAALHQAARGVEGAADKAEGLAEWCRLRPPRVRVQSKLGGFADPVDDLRAVQRAWKLPAAKSSQWPDKPEDWLDEDTVITGDPVMMLGMSTWTTGWTSCMAQPNGQFRRGVLSWAALKGTRLAALLSTKTKTVAGVTRRRMRARCLVHQLRGEDGALVFDRIYGDSNSATDLRMTLHQADLVSVREAREIVKDGRIEDRRVVGNVSQSYNPYCDSLSRTKATANGRGVYVFKI